MNRTRVVTAAVVSVMIASSVHVARGATFRIVSLPATGTDAAIDIDSEKTYTHTFDFGEGTPATINGVSFEQGPGTNLVTAYTGISRWGYGYTIDDTRPAVQVNIHAGNDNITADGASNHLLRDMIFHAAATVGGGIQITLSDLTPGTIYSTRWYYRAWGTGANRTIIFNADGESNGVFTDTIDINIDAGGAHYLDYTFTADSTDVTLQFMTTIHNAGAHIYGLSNEVVGLPTSASNPNPAGAAADVPVDVVLAWTAGQFAAAHDVYLGTAFADVNEASRANPMDVLVSQGQAPTAFDPGLLEFGTTYYWRIDEVNASPDAAIFKGDVWSFETEPYAYPVTGVMATASSFHEDMTPDKAVDGSGLNPLGQHSIEEAHMWFMSNDDTLPGWIQFEFPGVHRLREMKVWNLNQKWELLVGLGAKDVVIEYSPDGEEWTALKNVVIPRATASATYGGAEPIDLEGIEAKFVRLVIETNWGGETQSGLSEVRFTHIPTQAREPRPADGAMDVALDADLTWRPGREVQLHEVYFGTDADEVAGGTVPAGTQTRRAYTPPTMDLGTTYFWRVDQAGDLGAYAGELWSFTTQEFLVVEDFEKYNDTDNCIYETWVDGWNIDTNGSQVGHATAGAGTFGERVIVRPGSNQSMPLYYDNSTATHSEATVDVANLQVGQDWTRHGIRALTLYFRGNPDNSAEQMYVKLNGFKILYDGDAAELTQTLWQPWYIDLAECDVDLSSVTEVSIGFERIGAVGGSGVVYFDDIRLYPTIPVAGRFSVHPWTGDQDSGISSDKIYTHTGKFIGEGTDGEPFFAGNDVYFERDTDRSGTNWTLAGPSTSVFDTTNPVNVTGDGAALARGFFYGDQDDNHPVLTLTGLVPGTKYVMTFYTVGFGGAGGRFVDITPSDNPRNPTRADQNAAGSGNGQLIRYTYTATAMEMSFTFDAVATAHSWHHYAFSNEVVSGE